MSIRSLTKVFQIGVKNKTNKTKESETKSKNKTVFPLCYKLLFYKVLKSLNLQKITSEAAVML